MQPEIIAICLAAPAPADQFAEVQPEERAWLKLRGVERAA